MRLLPWSCPSVPTTVRSLPLLTTTSSPAELRADACFRVTPSTARVVRLWARGPPGGKGRVWCAHRNKALSYLLRSVRGCRLDSAPVRFQSGNSPDLAVNAGHWRHPLRRQKRPICRDIPRCAESCALLAMQKVVGSNPISRSSGSPLTERVSAFQGHLPIGKCGPLGYPPSGTVSRRRPRSPVRGTFAPSPRSARPTPAEPSRPTATHARDRTPLAIRRGVPSSRSALGCAHH
jgi:hypothetical protein